MSSSNADSGNPRVDLSSLLTTTLFGHCSRRTVSASTAAAERAATDLLNALTAAGFVVVRDSSGQLQHGDELEARCSLAIKERYSAACVPSFNCVPAWVSTGPKNREVSS